MDLNKINEGIKEIVSNELFSISLDDLRLKINRYLSTMDELDNYYVKCDMDNNVYLEHGIKVADIYITPKGSKDVYVNQISIMRDN